MAEILIQRKRHRNVWPWLLGLLALALLPLPFIGDDRNDTRQPRAAAARRDTTAARRDTAVSGDSAVPGGGAAPAAAGAPRANRTTSAAAGTVATAGSGAPAAPPAAAAPGAATPGAAPAAARTGVAAGTPAPTAPAATAPAGTAFERFIAARAPSSNDRAHAGYTAGALRHLADELRGLGASSAGLRAIRANADSLQMAARRNTHPDYARAAFLSAVRELDLLRARHRVAVDTAGLRSAAWAIKPTDRLVVQRATVQTFFERARDALQALSRAAGSRPRD